MHFKWHLLIAAIDTNKAEKKQKQSTIFLQVAADILYRDRRNIFLEVLLSLLDKKTNCQTYLPFNNKK